MLMLFSMIPSLNGQTCSFSGDQPCATVCDGCMSEPVTCQYSVCHDTSAQSRMSRASYHIFINLLTNFLFPSCTALLYCSSRNASWVSTGSQCAPPTYMKLVTCQRSGNRRISTCAACQPLRYGASCACMYIICILYMNNHMLCIL
jgi:hypothetical protein